jgi:hypothetical protein
MTTFVACSQSNMPIENDPEEKPLEKVETLKQEPHRYGGWYCPDNLNGFPAVDIKDWKNVPVVNGRMATKEETQNGTSLIFVDLEKYPDAKPLDMQMPQLARYYSRHTKKEEVVIVIQVVNISNDSVVGFRYLNGGNGSARFDEIRFLSDQEVESITTTRFVSLSVQINATQRDVWEILTTPEPSRFLQPIFDPENTLKADWDKASKVNFYYPHAGTITSEYADILFGNYYVQIDGKSENNEYVEKFLLLENKETKTTELKIVCGPYAADYEEQKNILYNWAQKVKELSEK